MPTANALILTFTITAYCPASDTPHGLTSAGTRPIEGVTAACDPLVLPRWSVISIPAAEPWVGLGARRLICEDTGKAVKGRIIDIRMDDCRKARRFGRRSMRVVVRSLPPN